MEFLFYLFLLIAGWLTLLTHKSNKTRTRNMYLERQNRMLLSELKKIKNKLHGKQETKEGQTE